jgi:hypothetical protein
MGKPKGKHAEVPKVISDPHKLAGIGSCAELAVLLDDENNPVAVDITDTFGVSADRWRASGHTLAPYYLPAYTSMVL